MSSPKIQCVITIDGDVWYEEKKECRRKKLIRDSEESKNIKRDKRILRLNKMPLERIKPVCDRQKCYENCVNKRLEKNKKNAKNRKQKDSKCRNKKHDTRNKKSITRTKKCVDGKTKSISTSRKRCGKKIKHKKRERDNLKIKSDHNVLCTTTSTGTAYIEGLSPISCEENFEFSYESISSDCFTEDDVEVRVKAKERTRKRSRHTKHAESSPKELEHHPKRTNITDPETNELASTSCYFSLTFEPSAEPQRSRTPSNAEDNATVFSSEMDVSIHSMATVVMSPRVDSSLYSPTTSPSELLAFYKGCYDDDDDEMSYKTAVKTEPYDCKPNDWFSLTCNFDSEVKTEVKLETKNDFDAGYKIKNEPNNNDCKVYSSTIFCNKKDLSANAVVVKKEKYFK